MPEGAASLDRPLHELLGCDGEFAPDDLAPPIDEDRLRALIENRLSRHERLELLGLVTTFRPWQAALRAVLGQ